MHERRLLRTLAEGTRALPTPYDVRLVLGELADRLAVMLDLLGSAVGRADGDSLAFQTSFGPAVSAVERTHDRLQAGPCLEALRTGRSVAISDLSQYADRWQAYVEAADQLGIDSVASIPMMLGHQRFGVVDLYACGRRAWSEDELDAARVMANLATVYLVNAARYHEQVELTRQLQEALDSRVLLEQAKGMVAARKAVSTTNAFELLRGYARQRGVPIKSVAEAVVHLGLEV